eukprot:TRINITY_DN44058_c0_g1_i1.p2 TRINITY_DN44058_c0_g1~~TRINITY_DN44058_c0_g1_i1.p2  ORF type:complete len:267 (+),score=78.07 TRINITY_DN44058_c0_g1_i1:74-874(+)
MPRPVLETTLLRLAGHLNEHHRDQLVAVARHFGGEVNCVDARCDDVRLDCIVLRCSLRVGKGAREDGQVLLRVPFPKKQQSTATVPSTVTELLEAAREVVYATSSAGAAAPLRDAGAPPAPVSFETWESLSERYCSLFNSGRVAELVQAMYTADAVLTSAPASGDRPPPAAATLACGRDSISVVLLSACGDGDAGMVLMPRRLHQLTPVVAAEVGDVTMRGAVRGVYSRRWQCDRLGQWRVSFEAAPYGCAAATAADAAARAQLAP